MFKNVKLGFKVGAAVGLMALMFLCTGIYSSKKIIFLNESDTALYEKNVVPLDALADLGLNLQRYGVNVRDQLLDSGNQKKWEQSANKSLEIIRSSIAILDKIEGLDEERKKELKDFKVSLDNEYLPSIRKMLTLANAGKLAEAKESFYSKENAEIRNNLAVKLDKLTTISSERAKKRAELNTIEAQQVIKMTYFIIGLCVLFAAFSAVAFYKNINSIIGGVLDETKKLVQAAINGELSTRGDPEKVNHEVREIVTGINDTLDAVIKPLNMTADYVDKIAKGNIPPKITDNYNGDFNVIKRNLNTCIDAVNNLVQDANGLALSAIDGKLSTRAEVSKHSGDFAKIVEGFNNTLNAVVEPINESAKVLERISKRDMTARVMGQYKGDHAAIKTSLNMAIENLENALLQVAASVEQVSSASTQISSGAQSLAQGSNEQASSLEEISASLEEMSSMVGQNLENAISANTLADTARKNAEQGNQAMGAMMEAIDKIKNSADQTAKIIKTIDEIAFQTNLLALNAAVEAARAGEAGKGFAVVAEEVRNLAQRSAEAAKNTSALIEESQNNASNGVMVSKQVDEILKQIVDGAKSVAGLISEVTSATNEQAKGIDQINTSIGELNKLTQTNASLSEESASAAEELNGQSVELANMVGEFNLGKRNALTEAPLQLRDMTKNVASIHRKSSFGADESLRKF